MEPEQSHVKKVKSEIVEKLAVLITGAFGLVAALAWNTAIQAWFASTPALAAGGPWLYAIVVTILAVLATLWIGWLANKAK